MNQLNRKRALADVVGVEAWHDGFNRKGGEAKLHIDVVFGHGRLGGGTGDAVRFRLAIKRAEIVVIVPPGEPVDIDPASVIRDAPTVGGKITTRQTTDSSAQAKIGIAASADPTKAKAKVKAGAAARTANSERRVVEAAAKLAGLNVKHMRNAEGEHRWIVNPGVGETLDGRPWSSAKRRLVLIDRRSDPSRGIAPTVRVAVRCRREDLVISDVRFSDPGKWQAFLKAAGHRNRIVAAEALIRTRLMEEGLLERDADLQDEFLEMTLADTVVES